MADSNYQPGSMDVSQQKATFNGIMKYSANWAIPACAGITALVTGVLVGADFSSVLMFILAFLLTRWLLSIFAH